MFFYVFFLFSPSLPCHDVTGAKYTSSQLMTGYLMRCLHDPANVQQTSSKRNAGRLLDVY